MSGPIRVAVDGAPATPGQAVRVVMSAEDEGSSAGVDAWIGREGVVEYVEYECGCGQHYPDDPMIGVVFPDGTTQEFWKEEIGLCPP